MQRNNPNTQRAQLVLWIFFHGPQILLFFPPTAAVKTALDSWVASTAAALIFLNSTVQCTSVSQRAAGDRTEPNTQLQLAAVPSGLHRHWGGGSSTRLVRASQLKAYSTEQEPDLASTVIVFVNSNTLESLDDHTPQRVRKWGLTMHCIFGN